MNDQASSYRRVLREGERLPEMTVPDMPFVEQLKEAGTSLVHPVELLAPGLDGGLRLVGSLSRRGQHDAALEVLQLWELKRRDKPTWSQRIRLGSSPGAGLGVRGRDFRVGTGLV